MALTVKINEAVQFMRNKEPERAVEILKNILKDAPDHPDTNYQLACAYDGMGAEGDAVPFYEKALSGGLAEGRAGAFLGLGSTYRCLGSYQKSLDTFDRGLKEFPEDRALKTFRALTLYNLGQKGECVEELLAQLLDTTSDGSIKMYDRALRFYADKLDQTWK